MVAAFNEGIKQFIGDLSGRNGLSGVVTAPVFQPFGIQAGVVAAHLFQLLLQPAPVLKHHTGSFGEIRRGSPPVKTSIFSSCKQIVNPMPELWYFSLD